LGRGGAGMRDTQKPKRMSYSHVQPLLDDGEIIQAYEAG
jgi:hypothetical protein